MEMLENNSSSLITRSQGGQSEPTIDPYSNRVMDTDAEYEVLSAIAEVIETHYNQNIAGQLFLYTGSTVLPKGDEGRLSKLEVVCWV